MSGDGRERVPSLIVNGIVTNEGLKLDKEGAVEVIVLGDGIVVARESFDGVDVVQESQHLEMRNVALHTMQTEGAPVPGRRLVVRQRHLAHPLQIQVAFRSRYGAMPNSRDHLRLQSAGQRFGSMPAGAQWTSNPAMLSIKVTDPLNLRPATAGESPPATSFHWCDATPRRRLSATRKRRERRRRPHRRSLPSSRTPDVL